MTTDLPFKVRHGGIVILKGLPVLQCENCPEYLVDDAVLGQVDKILAGWVTTPNSRSRPGGAAVRRSGAAAAA